jgi:hypothetical protein
MTGNIKYSIDNIQSSIFPLGSCLIFIRAGHTDGFTGVRIFRSC